MENMESISSNSCSSSQDVELRVSLVRGRSWVALMGGADSEKTSPKQSNSNFSWRHQMTPSSASVSGMLYQFFCNENVPRRPRESQGPQPDASGSFKRNIYKHFLLKRIELLTSCLLEDSSAPG
ncbi:unnamed protein product [Arctogadus glacialis]